MLIRFELADGSDCIFINTKKIITVGNPKSADPSWSIPDCSLITFGNENHCVVKGKPSDVSIRINDNLT